MSRPNVLWLVADHLALANRDVDPSIFPLQTRLRQLGVAFSRAYTVLPICTPARATMLTGLYPHGHGLTENDGRFGGRAELDGSDRMIQHDFAAAGYRYGWFGKWHLSQSQSALDFGFEGFSLPGYGYPYNTPEYRAYLSQIHEGPLCAEVEVTGESRRAPGTCVDLLQEPEWFDYEAGSAVLHGPEEVHEAHFLADSAIGWLKTQQADTPFFLRVDAWGPHPPYTIPTGFDSPLDEVALSKNLTLDLSQRPAHHRDYRDQWQEDLRKDAFDWPRLTRRAVEHRILVERALLRIVDHLEDSGQLDNTLIVFCADHGDAVASNGGVMNKGSLMVEETMRIPLVMAGPGIAVAQECDHLIGNVDLAPTLHALCEVNANRDMQGLSAANSLADPSAPPFRARLMVQHYGLHVPILQRAMYEGDWKYVAQPDGFEELYDLGADPYEMANLAEIADHSQRLREMRIKLLEEMHALGDDDQRLDYLKQLLGTRVERSRSP